MGEVSGQSRRAIGGNVETEAMAYTTRSTQIRYRLHCASCGVIYDTPDVELAEAEASIHRRSVNHRIAVYRREITETVEETLTGF